MIEDRFTTSLPRRACDPYTSPYVGAKLTALRDAFGELAYEISRSKMTPDDKRLALQMLDARMKHEASQIHSKNPESIWWKHVKPK